MASKSLAILLILSCGVLGGYASIFLAYKHGFLDAIKACVVSSGATQCALIRSHEYARTGFTGLRPVDERLAILFEFFAFGLTSRLEEGEIDHEAIAAGGYMSILFFGAWYLMAMEGLRRGNKGKITSYTGSFGLFFQLATITVISPIYLTLQLLGLPTTQNLDTIAIDTVDLSALPWTTTLSYLVPTAGLLLPILNVLSPKANYILIALWQPFPLYQSILQPILSFLFSAGATRSSNKLRNPTQELESSLGTAYRFVITICAGVHILVIGALATGVLPDASAIEVLAPTSLTHPPTLALSAGSPVPALAARSIVMGFLRWDIYCTSAAFVTWAAYLAHSVDGGLSLVSILEKIVFWTLAGGPISAAAILLWERDTTILKRRTAASISSKRK